jgi:hypothetical protein
MVILLENIFVCHDLLGPVIRFHLQCTRQNLADWMKARCSTEAKLSL